MTSFRMRARDALARVAATTLKQPSPAEANVESKIANMTVRLDPRLLVFVPHEHGDKRLDSADKTEVPVVQGIVGASISTLDQCPDIGALWTHRPPCPHIAMAPQQITHATMADALANIRASGIPTTIPGLNFPVQDMMRRYEIVGVANGPADGLETAQAYVDHVAEVYNGVAMDVLYHADPDATSSTPVTVFCLFEAPEFLMERIAPGICRSVGWKIWQRLGQPKTKSTQ